MRFPSLERDLWQLRPAEQPHAAAAHLKRGQAAQLIFDVQSIDEHGSPEVIGERMWVVLAESLDDAYIGRLDHQPVLLTDDSYLRFGAEVPFQAQHVIDVAELPREYADRHLGRAPVRRWPR